MTETKAGRADPVPEHAEVVTPLRLAGTLDSRWATASLNRQDQLLEVAVFLLSRLC
jgi:hypothetical protein